MVAALSVVAVMGTSVVASAVTTQRGHWALDEVDSAVAVDSSGFGNHGTNHNVVGDGEAYTFNGVDSRVIVSDPDDSSLDPGAADFSLGVTLSMTEPPSSGETYDALRKGVTGTAGGAYKLEIKNAKGRAVAVCVVKDAAKVAVRIQSQSTAAGNLADDDPHTVTCAKTNTGVTIKVDDLAPRSKTVTALGSVSNRANLALGAKAGDTAKTGFDWYKGKIHDAWVAVEQ